MAYAPLCLEDLSEKQLAKIHANPLKISGTKIVGNFLNRVSTPGQKTHKISLGKLSNSLND